MAIKARYKGDGDEYHAGIPKRNLTEDEYDELDSEQKAMLRKSPIYEVVPESALHHKEKASEKEGDN